MNVQITAAAPTVLIRRGPDGTLEQRVWLCLSSGTPVVDTVITASIDGREASTTIPSIVEGESTVEVYLPETTEPRTASFELHHAEGPLASFSCPWKPPRHWTVHTVQLSHHDVGYTDLASHVLPQQAGFLIDFLELARSTSQFPDDAQARIVIEQFWSLERFLRVADKRSLSHMVDLIRSGHVEVAALFGNMTTELCGHETLIRTLYPAARFAKELGVDIISAEHNDIPGLAWGLSEALVDSGVKFFCPGFPLYYGWGGDGDIPSFWDEEAIFGRRGVPGAFWWETPSGKRLMLWCNNQGCGGGRDRKLPTLAHTLLGYEEKGYPHSVVRWPVQGAARDNSPYIDYSTTVKEWNETWAYPRLICSTNARFYKAFLSEAGETLPVRRGDLPGQDYPAGATSTALATAVNRANHHAVPTAEALGALAAELTDVPAHESQVDRAFAETIWYDEHTWGHHFPCGPTNLASEHEKALHAHRAAALAHDVHNKAMARLADAVSLAEDGIHLVVFNPSPFPRSDLVSTPLREIDNCGSELMQIGSDDESSGGFLKPVLLGDRWHVSPGQDYVGGHFDIVDTSTNDVVPSSIDEIASPLAPLPYAAQRLGIAAGSRRYGFFEEPGGANKNVVFMADAVPAGGYKTYWLRPRQGATPSAPGEITAIPAERVIENAFYRIQAGPDGRLTSIVDKHLDMELIDPSAPHGFGSLIVRDLEERERNSSIVSPPAAAVEGRSATLKWKSSAFGHPLIETVVRLVSGVPRIDIGMGVLKDATPNLEAAFAFGFNMADGKFAIEEPLVAADPYADRLPGAFSNRLTLQDWLKVSNGRASVLWSSLDAPIVSIGQWWPHRVSQAHCLRKMDSLTLPPQDPKGLTGGGIYSCVCFNKMATNFSLSQSGTLYFRYVISSRGGDASIEEMNRFAASACQPFSAILTKHPGHRTRPASAPLLKIENAALRMLAFKRADDGNGYILRLWNPDTRAHGSSISLPGFQILSAGRCDIVERTAEELSMQDDHSLQVQVDAGAVLTLRLRTALRG